MTDSKDAQLGTLKSYGSLESRGKWFCIVEDIGQEVFAYKWSAEILHYNPTLTISAHRGAYRASICFLRLHCVNMSVLEFGVVSDAIIVFFHLDSPFVTYQPAANILPPRPTII